MKTSQRLIMIISIIVAVPLSVIILLAVPWILISFEILFSPNPQKFE